jgi:hypothetical protein
VLRDIYNVLRDIYNVLCDKKHTKNDEYVEDRRAGYWLSN